MILTSLHVFNDYLIKYWTVEERNADIEIPLILVRDGGDVVFGDRVGESVSD